jgi:hypothetical protein
MAQRPVFGGELSFHSNLTSLTRGAAAFDPVTQFAAAGSLCSFANADPAAARLDYELAARVATKEAWDAFLASYPSGYYADLARVHQGWGFPNLQTAYDDRGHMVVFDACDVLQQGQARNYFCWLAPGTAELLRGVRLIEVRTRRRGNCSAARGSPAGSRPAQTRPPLPPGNGWRTPSSGSGSVVGAPALERCFWIAWNSQRTLRT